jgi:uncharacterized protein YraI
MKVILLSLFLGVMTTQAAWAYTGYVQSVKADIYSQPSMKSAPLTSLAKGDAVTVVKENGSWLEVEISGKPGFVYRFLVSRNEVKPREKLYSRLRAFFSKIESISSKSRRRPSSYTATAAARGFREKREHFAEKYNSDYDTLERFEAISIPDKEALDFIAKGVSDDRKK